MKIAYFDCFSGAAGDMILGSLIDAGVDFEEISRQLAGLGLRGYEVFCERIKKQGLAATHFKVTLTEAQHKHRHLKHILEILNNARIPNPAREMAAAIFTRLAEAEAKVHCTTIEKVHFHEVGAVDAIVDIVGTALALGLLGIERVHCSPIPVGSGTIHCDHGIMPVPAPATAELLTGAPIADCNEPGELTTPTGAAILTTLAQSFGPLPPLITTAVGYGAGTREGKTRPNVLRVIIGNAQSTPAGEVEQVVLLETNLDDTTPQIAAYCVERLFDAGALDAWTQPIHMKKNRSGFLLCALCRPADADNVEQVFFAETPTLGVRRRAVERRTLARRMETVVTKFGEIRIKIGDSGQSTTATPEFEDCKAAALKSRVPLRLVQDEASAAWRKKIGPA